MRQTLAAAVVLVLAAGWMGGAHAQAYRWTDQSGNVVYGNAPPAGVHATPLGLPAEPSGTSNGAPHELTPAQEQQQYRKEELKREQAEKKAEQERARAEAKRQNCTSAQESLRTLESGERIVTIDAKGQRHYLDDAERSQREDRAREAVKQWCN